MTTPSILSRRRLIKTTLGASVGLLGVGSLASAATTPAQTAGPFHPFGRARGPNGQIVLEDRRLLSYVDRDSDLTVVTDNPGTALGTHCLVTGVVTDSRGRPVANAEVEIWQACVTGRYNHKSDPNSEWLDPEFQYWGIAKTDAQGRYVFRTVVPGAYRANASWIRPPHIHYKVKRAGKPDLVTQMYFSGVNFYYGNRFYSGSVLERLNARDQVLDGVPRAQRASVIAQGRLADPSAGLPKDGRVFTFDIEL